MNCPECGKEMELQSGFLICGTKGHDDLIAPPEDTKEENQE